MELNKDYFVNIVSSLKTGSFIIAPKLNEDMSKNAVNYRKRLHEFNACGEWFEELDLPQIEIGKAVIVQFNEITNEWARGIISKCIRNSPPEIYLIDTQTFIKDSKQYELRICPSKFLRLKLPTYTIHVDVYFDSNDDILKELIELMMYKNQCGELNIVFTPQCIKNYEYSGLLTVNNIPLKKYLKVLLKQYSSKKDYLSVFNPLKFSHLKNIFIPRHSSSLVFLDERLVSSFSDLTDLNDLSENLSYDPLDEDSSMVDNSEDFSDDSSLIFGSSKNSCIIEKQKNYSPFSSSLSISNSSTCSFDMEINSANCLSVNKQTDCIYQNSEKHQVSKNLGITVENMDENKSDTIIIENGNQDINKKEPFINVLMKKRCRILKQKNNKCQQSTNISDELELSKILLSDDSNISKISNELEISKISLQEHSGIIWSSDDES